MNDSFYSLAQEGINHLQVVKSLQGAMEAMMQIDNHDFKKAAQLHLNLINERARKEFKLSTDLKNITSSDMIGESQRHEH